MRKYITVLLSTCLITFTNANAQNSTPIPNLSEVGSHCMPHDIAPISNTYFRDCREMLKIVFDFPNELIDKVIEIS